MKKITALTIALIFIFISTGEVFAASSDFSTKSVELTSTKRQSTSITGWWQPLDGADGYEVQCSSNRFFNSYISEDLSCDITAYTFDELSSKEQYYFRIRAYQNSSDGITYTCWTHSENAQATGQPRIKLLKFSGKTFEIRGAADQSVGYYDTLQGGCAHGKYGYFTLYNRNKEKCKIAKFNLTTGKKIKVSKVLPISHGNDLAYNTSQEVLAAVHSTGNGKQVTIINPETLKIIRHTYITLDKPVPGMSEKRRAAFKGIGALAYNEKYGQYVGRVKSTNDLLFMDDNFKTIRYVSITKPVKQTFQGMDTIGDYVLVGQSFKNGDDYNLFSVYDWQGNFISRINIKKGYELECLFHTDDKIYAGFYRSYYKTYTSKTLKLVIKKGQKLRIQTKQQKRKLMRDNYVYVMDKL